MKKVIVFLLLVISLTLTASAGYVFDYENLLEAYEKEYLESELASISEEFFASVVIVTTPYIESGSSQAYADDFFDNGGFGHDGILLLVSRNTRDWAISTSGSAIKIFDDDRLDVMEDEIVPYMSEMQFYEAFCSYAFLCRQYLDPQYKESFSMSGIIIPIVIGVITGLICVGVMASKLKTVRAKNAAADYIKDGSFSLTSSYDRFLWRNVHKTKKQSSSSTHSSSSGRSHGGRSGKF